MGCTDIAIIEQPALPAELTTTLELAADFARASKAKATQEAYASDFRIFESWCRSRGLSALPASAESLRTFLADEATLGKRASTLGRRLAAIRYFHRAEPGRIKIAFFPVRGARTRREPLLADADLLLQPFHAMRLPRREEHDERQ